MLLMGIAMLIWVGGVAPGIGQAQSRSRRTDLQHHDLSVPDARWFRYGSTATRDISRPGTPIRAKRSSMSSRARWSIRSPASGRRRSKPGDVLFVPAGTIHWVTNVGS